MTQLGYSELQCHLRHRFPMILIDRVTAYEAGRSLSAQSAISGTSDWAQGHFPGRAVYPGTHIIQAFSQAALLLLAVSSPALRDDELTAVSSIEARFLGVVVPGDTLTYHVHLDRTVSNVYFFHGDAVCDTKKVAILKVRIVRRHLAAFGDKLLW